jgi:3-isopropylmalate dehydrogenase
MSGNMRRVAVMPGTGIGPEVTAEAVRVVEWFAKRRNVPLDIQHPPSGPEAWRTLGTPMPDTTLETLRNADAIIYGAAGGPEIDAMPPEAQAAGGLRRLRREFDMFANLRPVLAHPAMLDASTLKREVIEGVDMIILRELAGGIYFGEPRGIETLPDGRRRGFNTQVYTSDEVERIARVGFELARARRGRLTNVDKANVMESSVMWREEVERLHKAEFPDVTLNHLYVDNAAMQLVRNPRQFDVIVTDNIFGDILSDCAAMITGSLGMLPSAALSARDADGRRRALFEPVHGSAPDIAGQGIANPIGAILSVALALRHAIGTEADAELLERAVADALTRVRTPDIRQAGCEVVSTTGMGAAVLAALDRLQGG